MINNILEAKNKRLIFGGEKKKYVRFQHIFSTVQTVQLYWKECRKGKFNFGEKQKKKKEKENLIKTSRNE